MYFPILARKPLRVEDLLRITLYCHYPSSILPALPLIVLFYLIKGNSRYVEYLGKGQNEMGGAKRN